jgi:hypothetical protein
LAHFVLMTMARNRIFLDLLRRMQQLTVGVHIIETQRPYHRALYRRRHMTMIDLIRNADSEAKIYALLTSYVDALRQSENGKRVSQSLLELPICDAADLQARSALLFSELDFASRRLDNEVRFVYKEALAILATALHCIHLLKNGYRFLQTSSGTRVECASSSVVPLHLGMSANEKFAA